MLKRGHLGRKFAYYKGLWDIGWAEIVTADQFHKAHFVIISFVWFNFFRWLSSGNEVSSLQQLFSLMYVIYDNVRGDDGNLAENFTFPVSFNI